MKEEYECFDDSPDQSLIGHKRRIPVCLLLVLGKATQRQIDANEESLLFVGGINVDTLAGLGKTIMPILCYWASEKRNGARPALAGKSRSKTD
jgi:hypothetical protein